MKQIEGNSPKCWTCYYYREKAGNDGCMYDGWCLNPYQLSHGINGIKRETPLERISTRKQFVCRNWEDAEERISYFEFVTGQYRSQIRFSDIKK